MINKEQLDALLSDNESFRIEKTVSVNNMDKFCEAICAFSNDLPNSGKSGYLLIGVNDDNTRCGLKVTDELLIKITNIRSDGNILPLPQMSVDTIHYEDGDVLVVEITPSKYPPVRYRGRTCIRIGPRKGYATLEEEKILMERCAVQYSSFDTRPCTEATLDDIDTTKEWWDQEWVNTMSIHGSLFSLVGDFSIGSLQSLSCMCFNKNLFDDRKLEYPYKLVENGDIFAISHQ